MAIEHDYFGLLGSTEDGELYWSESLELGDQQVDVDLSSPDESEVSVEALDIAAAMIGALEELDSDAREAFVAELSSEESDTSLYVNHHLEELDEAVLDDAISRESGDRQIDFLRSMRLLRVGFHPHHSGQEEHFAVLDYSIAPDETDGILVAIIDMHGDVVAIDYES
ncbi:DUF2004 domain-containing protein [Luethyella okanaganae]|uniref:DUF2004 domain-containing protein n=1 Tax=Luethyella okanaganae TaxID=69372 RepID=A0ABW1VDN4_9MICO